MSEENNMHHNKKDIRQRIIFVVFVCAVLGVVVSYARFSQKAFEEYAKYTIEIAEGNESINMVIAETTKYAYFATGIIFVMLVAYLKYMRSTSKKKQSDLIRRSEQIVKEKDSIVRQFEQIIIATSAETYKGVRRLDTETGQAEYLYFKKNRIEKKSLGDWNKWLEGQAKYVFNEDYEQLIKDFSIEELTKLDAGESRHLSFRTAEEYKPGYRRVYSTTATEMSFDGKKFIIMATVDNTEAVEKEKEQTKLLEDALQKAEKASQVKTDFLFNMSHDVRTPMNAVIGFTDLLEKNIDDPVKRKEYLGKVKTSSWDLLEIINNVLEMVKIESGELTLEETPCELNEILPSLTTISDLNNLIKNKKLEITTQTDIEHDNVICDAVKVCELFQNLISNAIKYTPEGGHISLKNKEVESDRIGYAKIISTVEDNGIGMAKDFVPHLFEAFVRENNTTKSGVIGTGLGMRITKQIVDLMDGDIQVESELGKGTKFTVVLYYKLPDSAMSKEKETSAADCKPGQFEGKRILLAEDNELNAEIAIEILSSVGFVIEHAADGAICVDMIKKADADYYDCILMDIQMPNMNGYEATKAIRKLKDKTKSNIPILALTANAFEDDKKNAFDAGMNGHIAKPIDIPKLLSGLQEVLK